MKKISDKVLLVKLVITILIVLVVILGIFNAILSDSEVVDSNVELTVDTLNTLGVYTEEQALSEIEATNITLSNNYNVEANYKLYITIGKDSTIDYKYVRVNVDNITYDLSNINYLEIGDKYYFFLESGTIYAHDQLTKKTIIWIDNSYEGTYEDAKLYVDFATEL